MKRSEHLIQVLVVQVEVEVEVEQEKQVRAHHTLHWMLAEPPAKSSTIPNGSCVTIDARVVEELVASMVGSRCSEDG